MSTASIAVDVGKEPGQETLWVSVLAFGPLAESLAQHQVGDMLAVTGKMTRGRYTGTDGQERESWSLLADALHSSRTVRPGRRPTSAKPAGRSGGDCAPYSPQQQADFDDPLPS